MITDIRTELFSSLIKQKAEIDFLNEKVNTLTINNSDLAFKFSETKIIVNTVESNVLNCTELGRRIDEIENKLVSHSNLKQKIEEIESTLIIKENVINLLQSKCYDIEMSHRRSSEYFERKCDELEQYGRRPSLRIDGIPVEKNENPDKLNEIVSECFKIMGVEFCLMNVDRMHRVGKPTFNKFTKRKEQQIIIKFNSWESRCAVYFSRPRWFKMSEDERNQAKFSVKLDLTKKRHNLLMEAVTAIKGNDNVKFKYFNDSNQLFNILNGFA